VKTSAGFALAAVLALGLLQQPAWARERTYYIAADEVVWNYAPQNRDVIGGKPLPPLGPAQIGWRYHKAVYRQYADSSFTKPAPVPATERYRGLVGPSIHAEVGDSLAIVFRNRTHLPLDIAASGVVSVPKPGPVAPGATRTFRWSVTSGPTGHDGSSILFAYGSDVLQSPDENAGLIGPLIITRRGHARADGSPADVDREVVALFSTQDETLNPFLGTNLSDRAINVRRISRTAKTFFDDNVFPTINGYAYGNMPVPTMRVGQHVRWYLLSTMNFIDFHAPTWSGETVLHQGNRADSIGLVTPHDLVDMIPDNRGTWLLTCSNDIHLLFGMKARYQVLP
jgi:hypothetical protein